MAYSNGAVGVVLVVALLTAHEGVAQPAREDSVAASAGVFAWSDAAPGPWITAAYARRFDLGSIWRLRLAPTVYFGASTYENTGWDYDGYFATYETNVDKNLYFGALGYASLEMAWPALAFQFGLHGGYGSVEYDTTFCATGHIAKFAFGAHGGPTVFLSDHVELGAIFEVNGLPFAACRNGRAPNITADDSPLFTLSGRLGYSF